MLIYKASLHDIKSDVWCAVSATRITDHIYSWKIGIKSNRHTTYCQAKQSVK